MNHIYLDNGASTQVDPEVADVINEYNKELYGNASSNHLYGEKACEGLERARISIAETINADPDEIIFTSGGTESNNTVIKSIAFSNKEKGNHAITTKIEHDCILDSCEWIRKQGFNVTYLDVDKFGFIDADKLEKAITKKTILVSVIHGNNEIGTIQDIAKIAQVCKKHGVYFHTDACQSYTKVPIDVKNVPVDLITINAHKIHGPKGVGVLYIKKGTKIDCWQKGGGHEKNLRSGTENISGIVGFAKSAQIAFKEGTQKINSLRNKLIDGILSFEGTKLNGDKEKRLSNNVNVSFKEIDGEELLAELNNKGICCSTGSACSSKKAEPSHVLKAIGLDFNLYPGTIRFTLSRFTTEDEIIKTLEILKKLIPELRAKNGKC